MVAIEEMAGLDTSWGRVSENVEDALKVLEKKNPSQSAAMYRNNIRGPCSGAKTQARLPPWPPPRSPGCIMCWHGEERWPHHRSVYGSLGRWPWFLLLNYGKFILFIEGVASKSNKAVSSPWSGCGGSCHNDNVTVWNCVWNQHTYYSISVHLGTNMTFFFFYNIFVSCFISSHADQQGNAQLLLFPQILFSDLFPGDFLNMDCEATELKISCRVTCQVLVCRIGWLQHWWHLHKWESEGLGLGCFKNSRQNLCFHQSESPPETWTWSVGRKKKGPPCTCWSMFRTRGHVP